MVGPATVEGKLHPFTACVHHCIGHVRGPLHIALVQCCCQCQSSV